MLAIHSLYLNISLHQLGTILNLKSVRNADLNTPNTDLNTPKSDLNTPNHADLNTPNTDLNTPNHADLNTTLKVCSKMIAEERLHAVIDETEGYIYFNNNSTYTTSSGAGGGGAGGGGGGKGSDVAVVGGGGVGGEGPLTPLSQWDTQISVLCDQVCAFIYIVCL